MSRLLTEDVKHVWAAEITKVDDRDDGTIDVYGKATGPDLDIDDQICDSVWLKRAMPEWFQWGNIREMHTPSAAGKATELTADDDGSHFIKANIVDQNAAAKVRAGVYKGFSVGIKKPRVVTDKVAGGGRIVDGQIVEVSLVDRPANGSCTLELAKMAGNELQKVEKVVEIERVGTQFNPNEISTFNAEWNSSTVEKRDAATTTKRLESEADRSIPTKERTEKAALGRTDAVSLGGGLYLGGSPERESTLPRSPRTADDIAREIAWYPKAPKLASGVARVEEATAAFIAKDAGGIAKPGHAQHDSDFAAAWVAVARLIKQEAKEMEVLGEDETDCIGRLLNALYALRSYAAGEAAEGENVTSQIPNGEELLASGGVATMAVEPDETKAEELTDEDWSALREFVDGTKAATADTSTDDSVETAGETADSADTKAATPDAKKVDDGDDDPPDPNKVSAKLTAKVAKALAKALGNGLDADGAKSALDAACQAAGCKTAEPDIIKALDARLDEFAAKMQEISKSVAPDTTKSAALEDRVRTVEGELEQVKSMAAPGGVVRVANPGKAAQARAELDQLRAERADWDRIEKSSTDVNLKTGARAHIEAIDKKIAKLAS